jgi:hypothetical protein
VNRCREERLSLLKFLKSLQVCEDGEILVEGTQVLDCLRRFRAMMTFVSLMPVHRRLVGKSIAQLHYLYEHGFLGLACGVQEIGGPRIVRQQDVVINEIFHWILI